MPGIVGLPRRDRRLATRPGSGATSCVSRRQCPAVPPLRAVRPTSPCAHDLGERTTLASTYALPNHGLAPPIPRANEWHETSHSDRVFRDSRTEHPTRRRVGSAVPARQRWWLASHV